ncbi:MAG: Rrf2 family transcriptional regulator [Xanthomonadaceae bacterium]|nr:Rrf2 family transcriptional regulator [Xanthomonadaceae bacterium]
MHISAMEEYGLRCALQLARQPGQAPLPASIIAKREGISIEYVSKLMHRFRKAGMVKAIRGMSGGFTLAQTPDLITLKSVMESISGKKQAGAFCNQFSGREDSCVHLSDCSVRPVWTTLSGYFDDLLGQLTLADLIKKESTLQTQVSHLAASKTKQIKNYFLEGAL